MAIGGRTLLRTVSLLTLLSHVEHDRHLRLALMRRKQSDMGKANFPVWIAHNQNTATL